MVLRILIVEDEPLIAMDLEDTFAEAGFQVVGIAVDMRTAIDLARREHPDVATMDINLMNGSDGVETACRLYREFDIRSLFVSSHIEQRTRASAADCNPLGFVGKPFHAVKVLETLLRRETAHPSGDRPTP
ncbi:response regulator [Antarcticirhabdus aurantiaca]|uniref:Response regulator n=1 Tax=Antarcticirhabdus aurantiaca TaxID=2606717 RepID=A0ACD4NK56_9HYPH|nr:response regulator [Antarcticirhabdus aurantiaca]WAJ27267.1 response regulator [Jeongeuplla avenae]